MPPYLQGLENADLFDNVGSHSDILIDFNLLDGNQISSGLFLPLSQFKCVRSVIQFFNVRPMLARLTR